MNTILLTRRNLMRLSALTAALGATAATTSCSGSSNSSGGKGSVTWFIWGSPEELTLLEEFNDHFRSKHPKITLTFQPVASYEEYVG